MWIVEPAQEKFKGLYIYDYAATTKHEAGRKVMYAAEKEGFKGSLYERLNDLQWNIVEVHLVKVEQDQSDPKNAELSERDEWPASSVITESYKAEQRRKNAKLREMLNKSSVGRQYTP